MTEPKIAYSYDEAAYAVGMSIRSIQRAVSEGELVAHYRKGERTPRIKRADLEAWVDSWPTQRATA